MTKKEYIRFKSLFNDFMEREGLSNLTRQADMESYYFSWSKCDCCGDIAGDRINAMGYNLITKQIQSGYSICLNCEYYAEYGQLDDITMLEIDRKDN
jgi:hypothetical protein